MTSGETGPDEDSESFESLVPQVVAVVVACDPGDWFEESLAALAASDYPEMSVLVLDAGHQDVAGRVAAALPGAYVRKLQSNEGFGASANCVLDMVEGASHFLICHDDIAPDPDAVSTLVEESFRSNAAVVAPKLVSWSDQRRLLHVGMAADKFGAVVDRLEPGEIDHGQHDSVRDVFLTPGGCTLVRADLFAEIGGFDPQMFAMGEHLDLCWRAQVAGARVIVAPMARVRHLELLASGDRELPMTVRTAMPVSSDAEPVSRVRRVLTRVPRRRTQRITLQALERRHELRSVLKNYGKFHRLRVLPQKAILSVAEILIGWLTGHRDRAAAVIHAWRWNITERSSLRVARAQVQSTRLLDDASIRRLQLRGTARLNAFVRRAVTHGVSAARLGELEEISDVPLDRAEALIDEQRRRVARETRSVRFGLWALMAIVLVFGSRDLLGGGLPYVGQFLPFATWSGFLHRFVSGWQPSGVGTVASATPGTGFLGLGGLVLFGGTGLLQKVVVLGCIPVGALGMSRLVRGLGSARARIVAAVLYLAVPLPYDALADGRWDALLVYAACPWIVGRLARASGAAPFGADSGEKGLPRWRTSVAGRALGLAVLEALLSSVAPTGAVLTLVVTAGLALGSLAVAGRGGLRATWRILAVGFGATLASAVLLAPWSASVLWGPARWQELLGVASLPSSGPSWGSLLHLGVGPIGDSVLAWGFIAAGGLVLLIGTGPRLAWAGRAWVLAIFAWLLAWAGTRGWLGPFAVDAEVLLVPAACAIAFAGGLGMAAFEEDLSRHRFGWRQASALVAALCASVGTIPMLSASVSGRWDMPSGGYGQATSWMAHQTQGNFRVLWVGDPAVLPGGAGWQIGPGLAYSLSEQGLPNVTATWPGSSPGPAAVVGRAVRLAASQETVRLGHLLAPYAVRYVVVLSSLAPTSPGSGSSLSRPLPPQLLSSLATQVDLRQVISETGFNVFVDDAALPERAEHSPKIEAQKPETLSGWRPVLSGPAGATEVSGRVGVGTLFDAVAPYRAWQMTISNGAALRPRAAFGYAPSFDVSRPAAVTLRYVGSWSHGVEVIAETVLWLVVLGVLAIRRRWLARLIGALRRGGTARPDPSSDAPGAPGDRAASPPERLHELAR